MTTPTLTEMIEAQEQCAKDARAIAMMVDNDRRAERLAYADTLDATAALLRRLSDPSEEMLEGMARAGDHARSIPTWEVGFDKYSHEPKWQKWRSDSIMAMRAALSELLTGEASDA